MLYPSLGLKLCSLSLFKKLVLNLSFPMMSFSSFSPDDFLKISKNPINTPSYVLFIEVFLIY